MKNFCQRISNERFKRLRIGIELGYGYVRVR